MAGVLDDVSPLSAVDAGLGILQTGIGIIDSIGAKKRQRNLLSQRQAYQTPSEINDILQATQQNASIGLDPSTLNFLNDQTNNTFSSSLDVIQRIGGDSNAMASIFGQKVDALGNIAQMDTQEKMKNFSQYLSALGVVASNKAAEQKSQQDILKDKLQAEGVNLNTANQNISGGVNTITSAIANQLIMDQYGSGKGKGTAATGLAVDNTNQSPIPKYDSQTGQLLNA